MNSRRGEKGFSLGEVLFVAAIIGLLAVMTAPIERFFLRRLATVRAEGVAESTLRVAGSALVADARQARSVRLGTDGRLLFTCPDGAQVCWKSGPSVLERSIAFQPGSRVQAFPGVRIRAVSADTPLFEAVLAADGVPPLPVTAFLRNRESR